ncbi:hypothetical protein FMUND_10962 [Fusarium mundagurra]|uniref:Uncharacterized protein n=1 Tax=Fusarium mundagurra TaxID=1567541 RepID=A0A8H6D8Q7_9HYPO|nr:hypothetical protein FMUND_10962 [Fusarium mundagurra]
MEPTSVEKAQKKTSFKRHNLFDRGFFYNEEISTNGLPDHVEALRESILDFTCDEFSQDASDQDETLANQAADFTNEKVVEKHWSSFFRENFFKPLEESISATDRSSECHIVSLGSTISDPLRNESAPQPDHAFYFPIHPDSFISETTPHVTLEPHEDPTLFSLSTLGELYEHGLRPSPFVPFQKDFEKTDLKCFPWLVVEFKPKRGSKGAITKGIITRLREHVYCQAVNGSGCAVRLNEIAAWYEKDSADLAHIPPIPAVTTVGPEVRVWITYSTENSLAFRCDTAKEKQKTGKGYMMQCIWDGDMRDSHDIAKFRFILNNIYTWATRDFRPSIARHIDQWRWLHSPTFLKAKRAAVACRKEEIQSRSRQQSPEADESPTKQLERTIDRMMSLNLNERVTPTSNRHASPISASSTPPSSVRRSARIKARREAQLSLGLTTQLERSASRLKETIAAGPSKRRESGTKFLAGPIEVEVDGSTSDEDYGEVDEDDESDDDEEECEDDVETDEEESDQENLVWDYVRRKYVPVCE